MYFYDSAYQPVKREYAIPINEQGKCIVAKVIKTDSPTCTTTKWGCSRECKPVTPQEVETIVGFKEAFEKPMHELRHFLATCDDGCPNGHYCKFVAYWIAEYTTVDRMGHPLVCSNDGGCENKLRILRAASTHFPVLGSFLRLAYTAVRSHTRV